MSCLCSPSSSGPDHLIPPHFVVFKIKPPPPGVRYTDSDIYTPHTHVEDSSAVLTLEDESDFSERAELNPLELEVRLMTLPPGGKNRN